MTSMMRILGMLVALAGPASANDSTAEMGTGGLVLGRSDAVRMDREDLFISMQEVRVAYQFTNTTETDVETIVAFPMPDIDFAPEINVAIPQYEADNFLGFTVEVDGKSIAPELQQRAFAGGRDVTEALLGAGLSLQPWTKAGQAALASLTPAQTTALSAEGAVVVSEFDDGSGWKKVAQAAWTLKSAYWWRMVFPAGQTISVKHAYTPSLGGTVAVTFLERYGDGGAQAADYKRRFCMDDDFISTVEKVAGDADSGINYSESRVQYVLRTGANWASSIGEFVLTIDKGAPGNLVSFCGEDVKKTGPTTFEMRKTDFWPYEDLNILFIVKG
jgi:Domain of unknown function (DUF4424)